MSTRMVFSPTPFFRFHVIEASQLLSCYVSAGYYTSRHLPLLSCVSFNGSDFPFQPSSHSQRQQSPGPHRSHIAHQTQDRPKQCRQPYRKSSNSKEVSPRKTTGFALADEAILEDKVKKKKKTGHKRADDDDGLGDIESGNATGELRLLRSSCRELTGRTDWIFPSSIMEVTGPAFIILPSKPLTCLAVSQTRLSYSIRCELMPDSSLVGSRPTTSLRFNDNTSRCSGRSRGTQRE